MWRLRRVTDREGRKQEKGGGCGLRLFFCSTLASAAGFVEGTAAHYVWLVQHNPAGIFDAIGGRAAAVDLLDKHFRAPDGRVYEITYDPAA